MAKPSEPGTAVAVSGRMTPAQLKQAAALQTELEAISDAAQSIAGNKELGPTLVIGAMDLEDNDLDADIQVTVEEFKAWLTELAVRRRTALHAMGVSDG